MTNKEKIYILSKFIKNNTTLLTDNNLYKKYLKNSEYFLVILYKKDNETKVKIEEPGYKKKENELLYEVYFGPNLTNKLQVQVFIFSELGYQLAKLILEEYYK